MGTLNDGFGSTRLPSPVVTEGADLDPGQSSILGLLEAAINSETGDAWRGLMGTLRADVFLSKAIPNATGLPVGHASRIEVTPAQMTQYSSGWPLLAVYRQGEPELTPMTLGGLDTLKQEWSVDYVVGPLKAGHIVKLSPFCVLVSRAIMVAIMHGYHPDFRGGAKQFAGEFSNIRVKSIQGPALAASLSEEQGSGYYGMTVVVETIERTVLDGYADANTFETYTGYVPVGTGTAAPMVEIFDTVTMEYGTTEEDD